MAEGGAAELFIDDEDALGCPPRDPEALKVVTRSFVEMGLLRTEPDIAPLITEKYLPAK